MTYIPHVLSFQLNQQSYAYFAINKSGNSFINGEDSASFYILFWLKMQLYLSFTRCGTRYNHTHIEVNVESITGIGYTHSKLFVYFVSNSLIK